MCNEGRFTCAHIQIKTDPGPIFGALQYRCVGSGHLGPQREQKVSVCVCFCVCRCVFVLCRAMGQT